MKKFLVITAIIFCSFTACSDEDLAKTEKRIKQGQEVNNSTAPFNPLQPIIGAGLALALAVVEHKRRKHVKENEDFHEAVEGAFQEGDDQTILHLTDLSKHLDKSNKNKFNTKGSIRL